MSDPIFDPKFWRMRLHSAPAPHQILCICSEEFWNNAAERHRKILAEKISKFASVLDVGCAYGRLLDLMPKTWKGRYVGIDISPDFIAKASIDHPDAEFICGDIRDQKVREFIGGEFDWSICLSMKDMVINNVGLAEWEAIQTVINSMSLQTLILEYEDE